LEVVRFECQDLPRRGQAERSKSLGRRRRENAAEQRSRALVNAAGYGSAVRRRPPLQPARDGVSSRRSWIGRREEVDPVKIRSPLPALGCRAACPLRAGRCRAGPHGVGHAQAVRPSELFAPKHVGEGFQRVIDPFAAPPRFSRRAAGRGGRECSDPRSAASTGYV